MANTSYTNTRPTGDPDGDTLVVMLHGYGYGSERLAAARAAAEEAVPGAAFLVPDYPNGVTSNEDPTKITEAVLAMVDAADDARAERLGAPYARIVLVGFSLGALIARKAYVFARGSAADATALGHAGERPWAQRVERIVLLAGMNRGWSLDPRPASMPRTRYVGWRAASRMARLFRMGRLIHAVRRGSPFIVNLRIQWLDLLRDGAYPPPPTIQLLGDRDDVVSAVDSVDLQSGRDFYYYKLPDTGHLNVLDFAGEMGAYRKAKFQEALRTPPGELGGDRAPHVGWDEGADRVVFIMHGIRDYGYWRERATDVVEAEAARAGQRVRVIRSGYGYFPMAPFLLYGERQRNVRWFMDEYVEAYARYRRATFSFVGHSNGTYLLASALQRYAACTFDRVVFAGSVVPTTFPWREHVPRRVGGVMNLVATSDWVVGVFPGLFERFGWGDIGRAGHDGFTDGAVQDCQIRYVKSNHGDLIREEGVLETVARYALGGECVAPPGGIVVEDQAPTVVWASKLNWAVWSLIIAIVIGVGVLVEAAFDWEGVAVYVLVVFGALHSV